VPITIRAGKALNVTATEVVVRFRRAPYNVFGFDIGATNQLRFRIWPHAETGLRLAGKEPGAILRPQLQELAFSHQPGMDQRPYDRLIAAALDGNPLLFARQDAIEAAWGSSTKFWVTSGLCTPIAPAHGDRRKLMRSSLKATPGTIHLDEDGRGALRRR
jgi:glucose-6-phosphate 1-dehydrogenase